MNKTILGILAAVVVLGIAAVHANNNLVRMNNDVDAQWAQVDTVLQRRFDSIDQAVGALKVSNKQEL